MDADVVAYEASYPTPYATSPLLPLLLLSLTQQQKRAPDRDYRLKDIYDYVIVGAGSAGSTVARRLSEMQCVTVLLLEAGKAPPILTDIPASSRSYVGTDIDWQYLTTPQKYTAAGHVDRRIPWPSGKTLGGSSILNDQIYTRGNRINFDGCTKDQCERNGCKYKGWKDYATGWGYNDVLPYFKKMENNTEYKDPAYHGTKGPITMTKPAYNPLKKRTVYKAAKELGYKFVDPNARDQIGFYDYQAFSVRGQVCSTAKGYLVPIENENRTNLDIITNARVRKVLMDGKTAIGVEFEFQDHSIRTVTARREVILSAGATNSAQLLILSGMGPLSELKKCNISVIADLSVGLNMQEDPATLLIYEVKNSIPVYSNEIRSNAIIQEYIDNRTGALTAPEGFELVAILNNDGNPKNPVPDYMLYFADLESSIATKLGFTTEVLETIFAPLAKKSVIFCAPQVIHPWSRGTVALASCDPLDPPSIDPNHYADFRDIEDIVQGMKACERIMNSRVMKEDLDTKPLNVPVPGCEEFAHDEDKDLYFRCIVRTLVITTNHQVGTARMGNPKDPRAVVDPELRVKGIKNLRVVDASIMPIIPWGNPNSATIMVAEKASDLIKKTITCKSSDGKEGVKPVSVNILGETLL